MNSRERVAMALRREQPDRVPHCEVAVDRALAMRIMDWGDPVSQAHNIEANWYSVAESKELARRLSLDNISCIMRAPVYAEKLPGQDGRLFYGDGMIKTEADLDILELPDPTEDSFYDEARAFVAEKEDFSAWVVTRIGIFPTILSMGLENFSLSLFENRDFVEAVLDRYCNWIEAVAERVCALDFDVFVSTDDMAFKTAPYFSPEIFKELVLPRYQRVAEKITLPWVVHSDGNLLPFLDDLVEVGITGLHPLEKGAMDIRDVKKRYGDRLCLLGNLDLNILGMGTREDVRDEVRGLIEDVGPGGGYIITSGNSLAGYLLPENVLAFSEAVLEYGEYER